MSASRLMRTNNGSSIDFRPAGQRGRVAVCPIPEWIRAIGKRSEDGIPTGERDLEQLIASAVYVASMEQSSFSMSKERDAEIKEAVRLYISTWLIPPLIRAMELLKTAA